MADCLFCKIANKEVDSQIIEESDQIVAFRDINPAAPTHILVIPKRHIDSAQEVTRGDSDVLGEMFETMARLADKEGLQRGFRVVTNVGPEATQSIKHLHFHLIGGRRDVLAPGVTRGPDR